MADLFDFTAKRLAQKTKNLIIADSIVNLPGIALLILNQQVNVLNIFISILRGFNIAIIGRHIVEGVFQIGLERKIVTIDALGQLLLKIAELFEGVVNSIQSLNRILGRFNFRQL